MPLLKGTTERRSGIVPGVQQSTRLLLGQVSELGEVQKGLFC